MQKNYNVSQEPYPGNHTTSYILSIRGFKRGFCCYPSPKSSKGKNGLIEWCMKKYGGIKRGGGDKGKGEKGKRGKMGGFSGFGENEKGLWKNRVG